MGTLLQSESEGVSTKFPLIRQLSGRTEHAGCRMVSYALQRPIKPDTSFVSHSQDDREFHRTQNLSSNWKMMRKKPPTFACFDSLPSWMKRNVGDVKKLATQLIRFGVFRAHAALAEGEDKDNSSVSNDYLRYHWQPKTPPQVTSSVIS